MEAEYWQKACFTYVTLANADAISKVERSKGNRRGDRGVTEKEKRLGRKEDEQTSGQPVRRFQDAKLAADGLDFLLTH